MRNVSARGDIWCMFRYNIAIMTLTIARYVYESISGIDYQIIRGHLQIRTPLDLITRTCDAVSVIAFNAARLCGRVFSQLLSLPSPP